VAATGVPVGIHAHNDTGMAVANSIEAIRAGATHVQGTINGYGERCGNADLCAVMPTLELKMDRPCVGRNRLKELRGLSIFVDELANLRHDERLPYVGKCAFAHKAGLHVNAVEKNPRTVEHIEPELVGNERTILLSDGSGKSSVLMKAIEVGVPGLDKSSAELPAVVAALKDLEGKGYAFEAADASFRILVQKILNKHKPFFELEGFRVIVEKRGRNEPCLSEATIKVRVKDEVAHTAGDGNGPVDALDHALRKALTKFYPEIAKVLLTDFQVRILDPEVATGAKTRVLIQSGDGKETWGTVGVSSNIIEASWEALVDSVEYKLFMDEEKAAGKRRRHD
jgi:2-isopropylmalate synthase